MITLEQTESYRRMMYFSPYFNLADQRIELHPFQFTEVKNGEDWVLLPESVSRPAPIVIDNHQRIDPQTMGLIANPYQINEDGTQTLLGEPAYDFLLAQFAEIYQQIAQQIEGFYTASHQ